MTKSVINHDEELLSQAESIVYKQPDDGSDLHAHIYFPPGEREGANRPALVFFFASGWDNGRISQFAPQALHFANRGAVTILIEYRTRTSHDASPIASMQDARSALRWVRFYSDQLGVDPRRIVAIGALAGANIAAMATMNASLEKDDTDPENVDGMPNALVLLSPLIEVVKGGYGAQVFADSGTPLSAANLSAHIDKGLPPMLILHGTHDRLTPFANVVKFVRKMQRKENVCDLIPFEGRQHTFYNLNVDPDTHDQCNTLLDRFLVHLGFLPEAAPIDGDEETVRVIN